MAQGPALASSLFPPLHASHGRRLPILPAQVSPRLALGLAPGLVSSYAVSWHQAPLRWLRHAASGRGVFYANPQSCIR